MIPDSFHKITLDYNTNCTAPHAPIEITSPSPHISHLQQNISYNTFSKVKKIAEQTGINWIDFTYGPDAQRMRTKERVFHNLMEFGAYSFRSSSGNSFTSKEIVSFQNNYPKLYLKMMPFNYPWTSTANEINPF